MAKQTQQHRSYYREIEELEATIKRFLVENFRQVWDIDLQLLKTPRQVDFPEYDTVFACVESDYENRKARLHLFPHFFKLPLSERRKVFLHEMLHIVTNEFAKREETIINDLVYAFTKGLTL